MNVKNVKPQPQLVQNVRAALLDERYTLRNDFGGGDSGGNILRAGTYSLGVSVPGLSTFPDAGRSSLAASVEQEVLEEEARWTAETSTMSI